MKEKPFVTTDADGSTLPEGDYRDPRTNLVWRTTLGRAATQQKAEKMGDCGDGFQLGDDKQMESVIDRDLYNPATQLPGVKSDWYWTRKVCPDDAGFAFGVGFLGGLVNGDYRIHYGFVLACRPARQ